MFTVHVTLSCCWPDTTARLAATKAVAADANTTAIDVLERLGELNLHLHGLQRNYSELEGTVSAANQMIQDPEKNSEILFLAYSKSVILDIINCPVGTSFLDSSKYFIN